MTLLSRLGYSPKKSAEQLSVDIQITASSISVVVPVRNNQKGINRFLTELECVTRSNEYPREVIIVDNASDHKVKVKGCYPFLVKIVRCERPGPAAARNEGAIVARGSWLLFLDSDCIPTESTIAGYISSKTQHLGFAGLVRSNREDGILSRYYESQEILIPPEAIESGEKRPDYLITANCLIYKKGFELVGGFDEKFVRAGGEDIDIAFKLLEIGTIDYQFKSIVCHDFSGGMVAFAERFYRYGVGNRRIVEKYALRLAPSLFHPKKKSVANYLLSLVQYICMNAGYRSFQGGQHEEPSDKSLTKRCSCHWTRHRNVATPQPDAASNAAER